MNYFIGVDIGTQSTKAVLADGAGRIVAQHASAYRPDTPKPLWAEQWPSGLVRRGESNASRRVREAARDAGIDARVDRGRVQSAAYTAARVFRSTSDDGAASPVPHLDGSPCDGASRVGARECRSRAARTRSPATASTATTATPRCCGCANNEPDVWAQDALLPAAERVRRSTC